MPVAIFFIEVPGGAGSFFGNRTFGRFHFTGDVGFEDFREVAGEGF